MSEVMAHLEVLSGISAVPVLPLTVQSDPMPGCLLKLPTVSTLLIAGQKKEQLRDPDLA